MVEKNRMKVPFSERKWYEDYDLWLKEKFAAWKPADFKPMIFSGQLLSVESLSQQADDDLYLEMLFELDLDAIDIYIWPGLYQKNRERYDHIVRRVKENQKKLIIGYQILPKTHSFAKATFQFEPIFKEPPSFKKFLETEKLYTKEYISRYKPDYYFVAVEPATNEGRIGSKFTINQWKQLVEEVSRLVKEICPQTKTGAAIIHGEERFIDYFVEVPYLDILGFDFYNKDALGSLELVIKKSQNNEKRVWIAETWSSLQNIHFNEPWRQDIDARWLKAVIYLAQQHNIEGINAWWTTHFIDYILMKDQQDYVRKFFNSLQNKRRTATFYAYREVIQEVKRSIRNISKK